MMNSNSIALSTLEFNTSEYLERLQASMTFTQPPPELLHEIFTFALPHSDFIDREFGLCVNSSWYAATRRRKAIIQVCRAWYNVGIPFLYNTIWISRIHQLSLLYRTLRNGGPAGLQRHILDLRVVIRLPQSYVEPLERRLDDLLNLCPSLTSLEISVRWDIHGRWMDESLQCRIRIPAHITHLVLGEEPVDELMLSYVHNSLMRLRIYNFRPESALTFPSLTDLTVIFREVDTILPKYSFPALKRLTLASISGWQDSNISHVVEFCKGYGDHLRALQMHTAGSPENDPFMRLRPGGGLMLQGVLDSCPGLEHFISSPCIGLPFRHPRIQWLDFLEPLARPSLNRARFMKGITTESFPQLRGIRTISTLQSTYPTVSAIIPPSILQDMGMDSCTFEHDAYLHIRAEEGRVFCPEKQLWGARGDVEDGTYTESTSEKESDDDTESESIESEDIEGEDIEDEDETYTESTSEEESDDEEGDDDIESKDDELQEEIKHLRDDLEAPFEYFEQTLSKEAFECA